MNIELCEELGIFCRNPHYKGCYKKCPCNLSNNCSYYVDENNKIERLHKKVNDINYMKDIHEHLNIYFRLNYSMCELLGNG